ncbi:hypothetical protein QN362_09460, partial [Actimicrobium sp. CCC2.4]|uniref:hypothetical protein n=1 Tax=Actimicrobium sp. CCC2.4 TaxID=3048606 RepID=UPI002B248264
HSALPPSAHTYQLLIVKELTAPSTTLRLPSPTVPSCVLLTKRFVCLLQRNEIMLLCDVGVNLFVGAFCF